MGKIDHDFIAAHWDKIKKKDWCNLINFSKALYRNNIFDLLGVSKKMRFTPTKANSLFKRFGHFLRGLFNGANTVTTTTEANLFLSNFSTISNLSEFKVVTEEINKIDIESLKKDMKTRLKMIKATLEGEDLRIMNKANEITTHLINRFACIKNCMDFYKLKDNARNNIKCLKQHKLVSQIFTEIVTELSNNMYTDLKNRRVFDLANNQNKVYADLLKDISVNNSQMNNKEYLNSCLQRIKEFKNCHKLFSKAKKQIKNMKDENRKNLAEIIFEKIYTKLSYNMTSSLKEQHSFNMADDYNKVYAEILNVIINNRYTNSSNQSKNNLENKREQYANQYIECYEIRNKVNKAIENMKNNRDKHLCQVLVKTVYKDLSSLALDKDKLEVNYYILKRIIGEAQELNKPSKLDEKQASLLDTLQSKKRKSIDMDKVSHQNQNSMDVQLLFNELANKRRKTRSESVLSMLSS
ncbi:MAG: hypothetical protein EP298_05365 [Gammaproteobacteria bacterium]|nr:MAG: hypothetical protein EP298_05365 [Gammaproteobacteria bacterium]UTW43250.1 hypothetical protein KFE69_03650 [bacterium SCSIO 12844]